MLPTAQFTPLARYFIGYSAKAQGLNAPAGLIGSGAEKLTRLIFKGLPVGGELRVEESGITFTPVGYLQSLAFEELAVFTIPSADIQDAHAPHWARRMLPDPWAAYLHVRTTAGTVYLRNRAFLGSNREIVSAIRRIIG